VSDLIKSVCRDINIEESVWIFLPCGYINGSRRLMARVAQKRRTLDAKSTPLSTTDEITDNECEITAATIFIIKRH
jgi:hypothetical protein